MVKPAATGFVENRVFFQEAYEALQGALDAYEEALSTGGTPSADASGLTVHFEAADRQVEAGEFGRLLREALKDGDVTRKELKGMDVQCRRVVAAFHTLLRRVEGLEGDGRR